MRVIPSDLGLFAAAFLVGSLAVARLTRLFVEDHWPPVEWLRKKWDQWTHHSQWNLLLHCQYCLAPWFALADLIWAFAANLQLAWWFVNLWLAAAYVAAIVMSYDGSD